MNKLLLLSLLAIGCSKKTKIVVGPAGSSCTSSQTALGATITCTDGTSAFVSNGLNGSNGQNGLSAYDLWLQEGNSGSLGDFLNSLQGTDGQDGVSCGVTQLTNGALITCGTNSAVVMDGEDALSGMIGIAAILNPCGQNFQHDEVLLKLSTGQVLAVYDGGPHQDRLTLLVPNVTYQTTDDNNNTCQFSINTQGNLN